MVSGFHGLDGFDYQRRGRAHFVAVCRQFNKENPMKVVASLKNAKERHRDCQVVRRRGKIYVICKTNPRFKARQK